LQPRDKQEEKRVTVNNVLDVSARRPGCRRVGRGPATLDFNPFTESADALALVGRLPGVDFVLHRFAGSDTPGPYWMAWFGNASAATAATPALAISRSAVLHALESDGERGG
jgi:hypothetical protein